MRGQELEKLRLNKKYWQDKEQQYYEGWLKFKEREQLRVDNFQRVEDFLTSKVKNKVLFLSRSSRTSGRTRTSLPRGWTTSRTSALSWASSSRRTPRTSGPVTI